MIGSKTLMVRTLLIIAMSVWMSIVVGCTEQDKRPAKGKLSTVEGLVEYVGRLPAVTEVQAWQNEYGDGIVIKTAHYEIYSTLLDPLVLRQVPGFMESAYNAYQSQLPEAIETKTRFASYLFADREQWEEFTEKFAGANAHTYMKIKRGAYYLNGACVAYNIGRTRIFSVLGHEGWHQFNSKHFAYRLPSWLDEGIATLFEVSSKNGGGFEFYPERNGGRLQSLKKAMTENEMIPLAQLITLNPGQLVEDTDSIKAFYAQSYALVRFLREEDYGKRLASYHNLLLAALRGNWPLEPGLQKIAADRNIPLTTQYNVHVSPKLFAMYIDRDMKKIEREYLVFCQRNVYHIPLEQ